MKNYHKYHQDILNQKLENYQNIIQCSFEFFPPKNLIAEKRLWSSVNEISSLKPNFFSVTYGANSGERNKTHHFVKKINQITGVITAPHLTCIDTTSNQLRKIAKNYWDDGIKHIVALRGDTLNKNYQHKMYALDLVVLLKKIADFDISVAAYPELHPESKNIQSEIFYLKNKIDAGASRAITQFFFEIESYLRFRDACVKNGIQVDIIPGILPISNFQQIKRFSSITNVHIPKWIFKMFDGSENNLMTQKIIGSSIAIDIVKNLCHEGVKNFHFYTLNQSDMAYSICHILGLK
ncbi:methylenetetrahydrofolate reductase [Buchnera aphidicola (Muscaphis stroyani)]|uniref:Methylenetetrahydrofolate reductase n=1 Tax=Buchnera aphidicola (Muscaphis stroyani) TaxID=1241869 RepID=A0A4D6YCE1_9GAMM|nr:methylenetetrahydrofolate reductase [Buchnera aphidicola]QCI24161.1 methylenetetrahydrofolate reductase [Buchnera aphidicola (Muscaphis stroyani)]